MGLCLTEPPEELALLRREGRTRWRAVSRARGDRQAARVSGGVRETPSGPGLVTGAHRAGDEQPARPCPPPSAGTTVCHRLSPPHGLTSVLCRDGALVVQEKRWPRNPRLPAGSASALTAVPAAATLRLGLLPGGRPVSSGKRGPCGNPAGGPRRELRTVPTLDTRQSHRLTAGARWPRLRRRRERGSLGLSRRLGSEALALRLARSGETGRR